ncbi:hypothetical protein GCM10011396_27370 [Undibacterium terreum]|uniref:Uncharacterized protein n=1 Tax=Undibacterium terreum TaxID=1224302 RepID=A0A916XL01_9BURK|nr:hypothetical protein GCM10011396_27370 [Undibacterium terreum]
MAQGAGDCGSQGFAGLNYVTRDLTLNRMREFAVSILTYRGCGTDFASTGN